MIAGKSRQASVAPKSKIRSPGESDLVNYRVIVAASSTPEQFASHPQNTCTLRRSSATICSAFRFQVSICAREIRLSEYHGVVCVAVDVRTPVISAIMLTTSYWHLCSRQTPACKRYITFLYILYLLSVFFSIRFGVDNEDTTENGLVLTMSTRSRRSTDNPRGL